jgi:hypothetical protein
MEQLKATVRGMSSPLVRAKTHEKIATYSIAVVVGLVVVIVGRAIELASGEPSGDRLRMMSVIMSVVQTIVTLATLALIRHQVSVAVHQIEQAEGGDLRLQQLTAAVRALVDARPVDRTWHRRLGTPRTSDGAGNRVARAPRN